MAPRRHVESLQDTGREVLAEMMGQIRLAEKVLQAQYRPKGFNIGMNLGKAAGAGIPGHIHMHIVPRWDGDTNFMTVLGEVRVLPEDLGEAARSLRKRFASEAGVLTSP
ncbi:MAG: HIT domain-containing protein [Acidobacteriota bacterium]